MVSPREIRAFLNRVHLALSQCKYRILEFRQSSVFKVHCLYDYCKCKHTSLHDPGDEYYRNV